MTIRSVAKVLSVLSFAIVITGCGPKRVNTAPDPVQVSKREFLDRYGFFITDNEMKKGYPELKEPIRPFKEIDTEYEMNRFETHFWEIRDTDPKTPENEFRDQIDERIVDIQNEIFWGDPDIQGTRFDKNGGLRGDMAHIYLLYGAPSYKEKMNEGAYHGDLMVWYYIDQNEKPLFRFLFYSKISGSNKVFRNYTGYLEDTLKELSSRGFLSIDELNEMWDELLRSDTSGAFRAAMFEFSYYTDVTVDKALESPEPVALTAQRAKPVALGQPADLEGHTFLVKSPYHSFLPAFLRLGTNPNNGNPSFALFPGFSDVDWELKDGKAEAVFDLRISFQNKATRSVKEFMTRLVINSPPDTDPQTFLNDRKGQHFPLALDTTRNWTDPEKPTLRQVIDQQLASGTYIVNIYFEHALTKKYVAWREEVTVKNTAK